MTLEQELADRVKQLKGTPGLWSRDSAEPNPGRFTLYATEQGIAIVMIGHPGRRPARILNETKVYRDGQWVTIASRYEEPIPIPEKREVAA